MKNVIQVLNFLNLIKSKIFSSREILLNTFKMSDNCEKSIDICRILIIISVQ